jgi:hypothetical protein
VFISRAIPVKLLIKKTDNDGRLDLVRSLVTTEWTIEVVDSGDRDALASALRAGVSMPAAARRVKAKNG